MCAKLLVVVLKPVFASAFAFTTYTPALAARAFVFATYIHQPNQQSRLNQWLGRVQLNKQAPLLKQLKGLGLDLALLSIISITISNFIPSTIITSTN